MNILKKCSILIILFTLTDCSLPASRNQTTTEKDSLDRDNVVVDKNKEKERSYDTDTLKVQGRVVVFFTISQQEYDLLPKDTDSGVDEVLDDFNYYAGLAADSMKQAGYETMITGSRYIQIKFNNSTFKTFDRLESKENIVGCILSDGIKEPKIEYGVLTDLDLISIFNDFNKE
jgi:uncharacterized protein YdhG (YjbR/CyaY superfamily)